MPVETVSTINTLNPSYPLHDDSLADADSHLRNIKRSLQTTFTNITGPVTASQTDLNVTTGLLARIVALEAASNKLTGHQTLPGDVAVGGTVNVTGGLTVGGATLVPRGVITMWVGLASTIPAGWVLCDGSQGTPVLSNRFVIAAGDLYTVGQAGGSAQFNGNVDSNGYHNHVGRTGDAGAHHHAAYLDLQGQHSHGVQTQSHVLTTDEIPAHAHQYSLRAGPAVYGTGDGQWVTGAGVQTLSTAQTGADAGHVHGITADGAHTHTSNVDPAGDHFHGINSDGQHSHAFAVATTPPYYALCFIMKL